MSSEDSSTVFRVAAIVFGVLVVAAVVVYFAFIAPARRAARQEAPVELAPTPAPTPTPTLAERLSARLQGVTLATSDAAVRELVAEISARPELATWLADDDLVRRFVAGVRNLAGGRSPKAHLEAARPRRPFRVVERNGRLYVDPRSWRRYDLLAEVFVSLDTEGAVALYRELRPLFDDAFLEISRPGEDLDATVLAAIDALLAVPVPVDPVEVREKVVTYAYADPALEALSDAQRQLLRTGPGNVARIQAKLRELRAALLAPPEPVASPEPPAGVGEGEAGGAAPLE